METPQFEEPTQPAVASEAELTYIDNSAFRRIANFILKPVKGANEFICNVLDQMGKGLGNS